MIMESLSSVLETVQHDPIFAKGLTKREAVYERTNKRVILHFTTTSHLLPEDFLPIRDKLRECSSSCVTACATQEQYADQLRQKPELLAKCVKDCCVLQQPSMLPLVTPATVHFSDPTLEIGVKTQHALDLFEKLGMESVLAEYLRETYDLKADTHVSLNENAAEKYDAPQSLLQRLERDKAQAIAQKKAQEAAMAAQALQAAHAAHAATHTAQAPNPVTIKAKEASETCVAIGSLREGESAIIDGKVFAADEMEVRDGSARVHTLFLSDDTGSVECVYFHRLSDPKLELPRTGSWAQIEGKLERNKKFDRLQFKIGGVRESTHVDARQDLCEEKRVELHAHTKMSALDAVTDVGALIAKAAQFGHEAVAITDHGVTQAFPAAAAAAAKNNVKLLYGVEAYMFDDMTPAWDGPEQASFGDEIVVFDLETTGLSPLSCEITEIGAVRIKDGNVTDIFKTYVNAGVPIPAKVSELTGITAETIQGAPGTHDALTSFKEFCKDAILAAHNASFDTGFLYTKGHAHGVTFDNPVLDTLLLCKLAFPKSKNYKLETIAADLGIVYEAHRAFQDAECCARVMLECFRVFEKGGATCLADMNKLVSADLFYARPVKFYHIILLCKNKEGMIALNKLVSESHLQYLEHKKPRMPKSSIAQNRENLLIGSACESGELYRAIISGASPKKLEKIASFYDYLEIQPVGNNLFLVQSEELGSMEDIRVCNQSVVELGERLHIPVAATCDVHFLNPEDDCFRRVLQDRQKYASASRQPPLFFRTTQEMLDEFEYLGKDKAYEVVVQTPRAIAAQIETFELLPHETIMPSIEGAAEEIERMAYENARNKYGDPLPQIVQDRLERELGSIIGHGFSVLYYSAHLLVAKSNEDGYLVGSRGSVGSSLAATMTGITEVNPLPPHYVCPNCKHSDFDVDLSKYDCGMDMPDANCPECGTPYRKEGFNIPFEVFLGIDADKVPDIDLNFSSEYQNKAHKYTEELFGKGHVFRAGTISSLQDRNAFAYAKGYMEDHGLADSYAETVRLQKGISGVKKTTGQHPGGMVIVPRDREVYEFTAVQWPANEEGADFVTTHFDFNSMHDVLVKLDILGHDAPTIMRLVQELTGVDPLDIPIADPTAIRLFSSIEPLGIRPDELFGITKGTLGVPEFGTGFVRQMLEDTKPTTVAEIVRISGLSHGTGVWIGNAQDLVRSGTCTLSEAICARDDIMNYLVARGVDKREAFFIMEDTRKGKVARNGFSERGRKALDGADIPQWFLDACQKIQYMFPKGHAVAYCLMALRIAYCKVYMKEAFYATYFDVNVDNFDSTWVKDGLKGIRERYTALPSKKTANEQTQATILELCAEMYLRGMQFLNVDIMRSDPVRFLIEGNGLRLPLISVPQLGEKVAIAIKEEREKGSFISVEDLKRRTKLSASVAASLKECGALGNMTERDQISLFDF